MQGKLVFVAAMLIALADGAVAQDAPAGNGTRGKRAYEELKCSACHGTTGAGAGWAGPKLSPDPMPWDAFLAQLRHPRRTMPPYRVPVLTDAEAADIYAYLRGIPPGKSLADIDVLRKK